MLSKDYSCLLFFTLKNRVIFNFKFYFKVIFFQGKYSICETVILKILIALLQAEKQFKNEIQNGLIEQHYFYCKD